MKIKTIGVFTIGVSGWLYIKCKAGSHDFEIRFESTDLADLKHAVDEMIRSELRDSVGNSHLCYVAGRYPDGGFEKCGCKTGANSRLDWDLDIVNRQRRCLKCGDISDIN